MINDVRNTVLAILNKDNRGSITVDDFNLYSKQSQLEIFEQYFHDYALAVNKRNQQRYSTGHSNIPERLEEIIDFFTDPTTLTYNGISLQFTIPDNTYKIGTLIYNNSVEVEIVPANKIFNLISALDVTPDTGCPAGVIYGDEIKVYPTSIASDISALRTRYPLDPKWTYNSFSDGEPLFNQSASDYQDFEIPKDDFYNLVAKICQYAGTQIREPEVVQFVKGDEIQEKQEQK